MLSGWALTNTGFVKFIVGVSVIERRAKTQLMPVQPSDNTAAVDQASIATSTPVAHSPAAKDSPNITPVRSKSLIVLVAYTVTCFMQLYLPVWCLVTSVVTVLKSW